MSGCNHFHLIQAAIGGDFVARHVTIPSKLIYNLCGPESAGPPGWTDSRIQKRKDAAERYIATQNRKNGFYEKLEESVLREGFRNPILVTAGWALEKHIVRLPEEMRENHKKILVCDRHGGSRLWVAQKHNMDIPCIVSDFNDIFPNEKILKTQEEIQKHFMDTPQKIKLNPNGISVSHLPQIHLEED